MLWGRSELQTFNVPALESVDDKLLRNLYSESIAVVMFLRNSSNSLNVQNYPKFKDIIDDSQWTYLSQHWLSSDPIDYNKNTEVGGNCLLKKPSIRYFDRRKKIIVFLLQVDFISWIFYLNFDSIRETFIMFPL